MAKKVVVTLEKRRKKINQPAAHRARLRERLKTDPRFTKNAKRGLANGNPYGYNQYTAPKGAKNITEAMKAYINDPAPPLLCLEVGLEEGSSFADVIAKRQLIIAAGGSLQSTQYSQDVVEGKMSGPGGPAAANVPPVKFVLKVKS